MYDLNVRSNTHLDGVVLLLSVHALVNWVREVVATVLQHAVRGFIFGLIIEFQHILDSIKNQNPMKVRVNERHAESEARQYLRSVSARGAPEARAAARRPRRRPRGTWGC